MKKLGKVIGVLLVFVAIVLAIAFYATSGVVEQADVFFASLRGEEGPKVGSLLSEEFRRDVKPEVFNGIIGRFGLSKVTSVSWSNRSVENSLGVLNGKATIEDGRIIPLELKFIKKEDGWKLLGINVERPGVIDDPKKLSVPEDDVLIKLSKNTMSSFAEAVKTQDFNQFYETISNTWKLTSTPSFFKKAFKPLLEKNYDLTLLNNHELKLLQPGEIDSNGLLNIKGNFPSAGTEDVKYRFSYINEYNKWKLTGLHVLPVAEESKT